MPEPVIPARPIDRFLELFDALMDSKSWHEDAMSLRYSASSLVTLPGQPSEVVRRLRDTAEALKQNAGWFGPLNSSVRFVVAAVLLQSDMAPASFCADIERLTPIFKEHGMRRHGALAVLTMLLLMLHGQRTGGRVSSADVRRMAAIYKEMRGHHKFLTGADDEPACALLAGMEGNPAQIAARCEVFYEGLRHLGFGRGNALQQVSHILAFGPGEDRELMRRFSAIYKLLDESGLWMHSGDYDEVAVLALTQQQPAQVVRKVLEHRELLAAHKPRPGKELSFSLACGTAFLELARGQDHGDAAQLHSTQSVLAVQAILQAQQAAMIAACSGAAAAGASH